MNELKNFKSKLNKNKNINKEGYFISDNEHSQILKDLDYIKDGTITINKILTDQGESLDTISNQIDKTHQSTNQSNIILNDIKKMNSISKTKVAGIAIVAVPMGLLLGPLGAIGTIATGGIYLMFS